MTTELVELQNRSSELAKNLGDEESLEVNAAILDLDPGSPVFTNRLGIGLINAGRFDDAIAVLENGVLVHPDNSIMSNRLEEARKYAARPPAPEPKKKAAARTGPPRAAWTDFVPSELVEHALKGPGRDACIRLSAASILASEAIDANWTAVTPIKVGKRYRVIGGIFTGVSPWNKALTVAVPVTAKKLIEKVTAVGGEALEPSKAVPCLQLVVPRDRVDPLYDELLVAHTDHLKLSLAFGPPTHMKKHNPGLRDYILEQAAALG